MTSMTTKNYRDFLSSQGFKDEELNEQIVYESEEREKIDRILKNKKKYYSSKMKQKIINNMER